MGSRGKYQLPWYKSCDVVPVILPELLHPFHEDCHEGTLMGVCVSVCNEIVHVKPQNAMCCIAKYSVITQTNCV